MGKKCIIYTIFKGVKTKHNQMNTDNKHRKEVYLTSDQVKKLQAKADSQNRSLKNYMEFVLIKDISNRK